MKYVWCCIAFFVFVLVVYSKGVADGKNKVNAERFREIQEQLVAVNNNTLQTLDFQRIISNNNDECFSRVWDEEIIRVVNPQLR